MTSEDATPVARNLAIEVFGSGIALYGEPIPITPSSEPSAFPELPRLLGLPSAPDLPGPLG